MNSTDRSAENYPNICVVTQPLGDSDPTATSDLLAILSAITTVSLITIDLSSNSTLRRQYEVIEISEKGVGINPIIAGIRFINNQIKLCSTIYKRDEDLILFYGAVVYVLPIGFSRLIGKTVVVEPRADVPLSIKYRWEEQIPEILNNGLVGLVRLLERSGYRLSHAIIVYSPSMAEQLNLFKYQHKLFTNGARFIDTETFAIEIPFDNRPKRVGYIGRFDEEKGIRTLAQVAKKLPDDVTFHFVGDGTLRKWLESELADEIEAGKVELRGWVAHNEVAIELNNLKLLVMPSKPTEGLPTLILEAMACGTPVYATPVSGIPDVVICEETGFLMNDVDPARISEEIDRILKRDDISRIGISGSKLVNHEYSFDAAIERYTMIMNEIKDI